MKPFSGRDEIVLKQTGLYALSMSPVRAGRKDAYHDWACSSIDGTFQRGHFCRACRRRLSGAL